MKSLSSIKEDVCVKFEISPEELMSQDRRRLFVLARLEFAQKVMEEGYSMRDVGMVLGNRAASTISKLLSRKR